MSSISHTGSLAPQSRLQGRYIIRKTIGKGGMSFVYKAIDTQEKNRIVAIKEMNLSYYQSPAKLSESEELFRQEAEILSKLSHPNLPRVYAFFHENGRSYLVMDFIRGKTLRQLLTESETKRLPVEDMIDYALQLCDALSYLHQQTPPIIFRDLKPGNVMVTTTGNIYLIDFGIARLFKQGLPQDTQRLGTPGFASPEQYGSGQTGPRSDLYSLGATLHYCLTGKDPKTNQPTLFNFLPANEDNPHIPLNLSQLIQRLVATREDQRPPDAKTVQQELLAIQQQPSQAIPNVTSGYDPKIAFAAQLSSQIIRHTRLPDLLNTSWTNMIVPLVANIYATLYAWLLLTIVPRSKQLYHNSLQASSSWTTNLWHSLSTRETWSLLRDLWTPYFTLIFASSIILMVYGSFYMLSTLHYPIYIIILYFCLFLLLHLSIASSSQRIRHPLARGILTTITLLLLPTVIALLALPEVQPVIQAITLNQLLSTGIIVLITVSLLRPKERFGWVDHLCLATIAATYALLLSSIGTQAQQQWLSIFQPVLTISVHQAAMLTNYILICSLCISMIIEIARYKYPFMAIDHILVFIVALIAAPLQFSFGLQEIPHLSLFTFHIENLIKGLPDLVSFNTLLTGTPVIVALFWIFIAPNSSYLSRLPLLPLALTCAAIQSFLGPITYLPMLKTSSYPLAYSLDSILHFNPLTTHGLVLIISILLYRWQYPFKWFEQFSLSYVVIICTLLQNAAWNTNSPSNSAAILSPNPKSIATTESQLYLLAINRFLAQILIVISVAVIVIAISNIFLRLAREFAWIDQQIARIKQRFNWLDQLILQLNHLILLITSITCISLLWLQDTSIQQLIPALSFTMVRQLLLAFFLIASLFSLIRISRPFNGIDRCITLINVITCSLVLLSGRTQQKFVQGTWKIVGIKPWLANLHIIFPPQTIAFGLLLIALVSLIWIKRRVPQMYRSMLKVGFGLALACTVLQWFNSAFLLVSLIMLTLSILLAIQVEQV